MSFMPCACQSREPDSRRSRVKVWLRETSSVRCIAVVVDSLTCIVSDKQLTSGLAGISMTLVLLSLGSLYKLTAGV